MRFSSRTVLPFILFILTSCILQGTYLSSPVQDDSDCQGDDGRLLADCYRRLSADSCLTLWRSDPYGCNGRRTLGLMIRLREDLKLDSLSLDSVLTMFGQPNELYYDNRLHDSPSSDERRIRAVYYMQSKCIGGAPDYRESLHLRMTLYFDPHALKRGSTR